MYKRQVNKQPSRIGLYLVLIIALVAGYFYLNNQVDVYKRQIEDRALSLLADATKQERDH